MRLVVQKCQKASVSVDNQVIGQIEKGFMILVGVSQTDTIEDIDYLVKKVSQLRVFEDNDGKLNLNIHQAGGKILSISQFTLLADTKKGNRPSFVKAASPDKALSFYDVFNDKLREQDLVVETGQFGAHMLVDLVNEGPVTIIFDTENK